MPDKVGSSSGASTYYSQANDSTTVRSEPESRRSRRSSNAALSAIQSRHAADSDFGSVATDWRHASSEHWDNPFYNPSMHSAWVRHTEKGSDASFVTANTSFSNDSRSNAGSNQSSSSIDTLSESGDHRSSHIQMSSHSSWSSDRGSHLPLSSHPSDVSENLSEAGDRPSSHIQMSSHSSWSSDRGSHLPLSSSSNVVSSGASSERRKLRSIASGNPSSLNDSEIAAIAAARDTGRFGRRGAAPSEMTGRSSSAERADIARRLAAVREGLDVDIPASAVSSPVRRRDEEWLTASDLYLNTAPSSAPPPSRRPPLPPKP